MALIHQLFPTNQPKSFSGTQLIIRVGRRCNNETQQLLSAGLQHFNHNLQFHRHHLNINCRTQHTEIFKSHHHHRQS